MDPYLHRTPQHKNTRISMSTVGTNPTIQGSERSPAYALLDLYCVCSIAASPDGTPWHCAARDLVGTVMLDIREIMGSNLGS
jgi:hypothetical protein